MSWIAERGEGTVLSVRVVPRASRDSVDGVLGDALKVRLRAPPVEGKANRALAAFLADRLGVPARRVCILRGETGRRKSVFVSGLAAADVRRKLRDEPTAGGTGVPRSPR